MNQLEPRLTKAPNPSFEQIVPSQPYWSPRRQATLYSIAQPADQPVTFSCYEIAFNQTNSLTTSQYLIFFGGFHYIGSRNIIIDLNDVWISDQSNSQSDNDWCFISGETADSIKHPIYGDQSFQPVQYAAITQSTTQPSKQSINQLFIAGGVDSTNGGPVLLNSVYQSINGFSWSKINDAPWEPRYAANLVVDQSDPLIDRLIIMGGLDYSYQLTDCWQSIDQGRSWARLIESSMPTHTGPINRVMSQVIMTQTINPSPSSKQSNNRSVMLLLGGQDNEHTNSIDDSITFYQDVWLSIDQSISFAPLTLAAPFARRADTKAVVGLSGTIVMLGGYASVGRTTYQFYNDGQHDV